MYDVDIAIIGAGVTGLSIALSLSLRKDFSIVVIEKEPGPGRGVSSRSSEVIHAGIYYPEDFLKTKLCVEGAKLLYEFCNKYEVPALKVGKLIISTDGSGADAIETLHKQGIRNGVERLSLIDEKGLKIIEPNVRGISALYSPDSGIIDSHSFIKIVEALASNNSVGLIYKTELTSLELSNEGYTCTVKDSCTEYSFRSRIVINAAGLGADEVARMAGIDIDISGYRIHKVKGEYFRLKRSKARLINGLIYPSPDKDLRGLGIHTTKDIAGEARLGPNAFYVDALDYDVDPSHKKEFYLGVKDFLPFIEEDDLTPDTAGIRPKIQTEGEKAKDFIIRHEKDRNLPGLINLIGIESPGLTSCLAIGRHVYQILLDEDLL
ncbi:MAG TPA: NAD(P)/FAD-dependent oxidoreductase [Desulfomonilia bacterium]